VVLAPPPSYDEAVESGPPPPSYTETLSRLVTDSTIADRILNLIPRSIEKSDRIPHSVPLGLVGSSIRSDPISDPIFSVDYALTRGEKRAKHLTK
jgi:hypothetical protein